LWRKASGSSSREIFSQILLSTLISDVVEVQVHYKEEVRNMGADDKMENAGEKLGGKAKEAAGKLTDNERLEAEGKGDQTKADLKGAGEKLKDAFKKD
jgi:uncharacterized protein YjbJ (UPF0337 family)